MSKTVLAVGAIILVVVAIFFGLKYSGFYKGTMKSSSSGQTSNIAAPANEIVIQANAFSPDTLTVKVGTKVTWTNNDSYGHTVTSDTGLFDSGQVSSGQGFSYTFTKVGAYPYHCAVHAFMNAKIVVTN